MRRSAFVLMGLIVLVSGAFGQVRFRSGIFLHHSTGLMIWGPNGSATSIPLQIDAYNASHGFIGDNTVSLSEMGWPSASDNEWERWHRIFENRDTAAADIRPILAANKIVMIKSCFPSSDLFGGAGTPSDTTNWATKSVANGKWHWRHIVSAMSRYPSNFFVIWTNAPLVNASDERGALADWFCRWAKDTLAAGFDPEFGPFPPNVFVFDYFHAIADSSGRLPLSYAASSTDSHPNSAATALIAPMLVQQLFDAAIVYETEMSLPVSITRFSAALDRVSGTIILEWQTVTESDCYGFEIERRKVGLKAEERTQLMPEWQHLGFMTGAGTSSALHQYVFADERVPFGRFAYRLKQIDHDGTFRYYYSLEVENNRLPDSPALLNNFPNPFNPETVIRYQVPGISDQSSVVSSPPPAASGLRRRAGAGFMAGGQWSRQTAGGQAVVSLRIYDALGREVAILVNGIQPPGSYDVVWNARNVPSGVYFYRLNVDGMTQTRSMMLLR